MATIQDKIAALETEHKKKIAQLKAQDELIQARKLKALLKGKRSDDTRRKILVGAAILAKVERGEWPEEKFVAMMSAILTRPDDRALFNLPEAKTGGEHVPATTA